MDKKTILIADPCFSFLESCLNTELAKNYRLITAQSGPECLEKIKIHQPHLVILELQLPKMHAIELLHRGKKYGRRGYIITSYLPMTQNYHASTQSGAVYYLLKPFSIEQLVEKVRQYFRGSLKQTSLSLPEHMDELTACYTPVPSIYHAYIRFGGTRGSIPVSGPEYLRYGGNTSCLEIKYNNSLVIIDAGTGIRALGEDLIVRESSLNIHLFISHTHWDHITAFPFFAPLYHPEAKVDVYAPVSFEGGTKSLFDNILAHSFFPVRLDEMQAHIQFHNLRDQTPITIGEITISPIYTFHPGPTLGFKIQTPTKTVGYITDNEMLLGYHGHPKDITLDHPLLVPHLPLIEALRDCDVLVHEAQYFPVEYHKKVGWGHSSIANAAVLPMHLRPQEWIATHHDPQHTDYDLQLKTQLHRDILKECDIECSFRLAYDGLMVPLY